MATTLWPAMILALSFNAAAAQGDTAAPSQALTAGTAPALKGLVVAVASGTQVRLVKYSQLPASARNGINAMFAASPAAASSCTHENHGSFHVATCQDGAWICSAVHASDGLTAGHCVNGTTGQRWSYP